MSNTGSDQWSLQSKQFFMSLVRDKKVFNAKIVKFDFLTNYFQIELNSNNDENINKILIDQGYAFSDL